MQQFCPVCFRLIPLEADRCPHCEAELTALTARDFEDKLIAALDHPLADVRMRAVIALGWRGAERAAQPLAALALRHPVDVVEGLAIVESLARFAPRSAGRVALALLAERHAASAVRTAAQERLGDLDDREEGA